MDNVGIVVESLDAAISFFAELGLELEGRAMIEGDWSGRVTGLRDQRVETAMMRMPDGHGGIELSRFLSPPAVADHRNAPVNALGYLRVMFAVDDLDDTLARLREPRRPARRRSGPVRGRVSALLRPRPRGHSHRAGRANRLTPKSDHYRLVPRSLSWTSVSVRARFPITSSGTAKTYSLRASRSFTYQRRSKTPTTRPKTPPAHQVARFLTTSAFVRSST